MADAGTLSIRISADNSQAKRVMAETSKIAEATQKDLERMQQIGERTIELKIDNSQAKRAITETENLIDQQRMGSARETIELTADNSQVKDVLKETQDEAKTTAEQIQRTVEKTNQAAERTSQNFKEAIGSAIALERRLSIITRTIAMGGLNIAQRGARGVATMAGGFIVRRAFGGIAATLARFSGLLAPLAALVGISVGIKAMVSIQRRLLQTAEEQSNLMSEQIRASIDARRDLRQMVTIGFRQQDVRRRSLPELEARLEALNALPTALERRSLASLAEARNDLIAAQAGLERSQAALIAPYAQIGTNVRSRFDVTRSSLQREFTERQAGVGLRGQLYGSAALTGLFGPQIGGLLGSIVGEDARIRQFQDRRNAGQDRLARIRGDLAFGQRTELAQLFQRGPGATLQQPGTVRAGDVAEYQFRVQQQRFALQQEATLRWQNDVLTLLRRMVENGDAQTEQQVQTQIQFGINPVTGQRGVD